VLSVTVAIAVRVEVDVADIDGKVEDIERT